MRSNSTIQHDRIVRFSTSGKVFRLFLSLALLAAVFGLFPGRPGQLYAADPIVQEFKLPLRDEWTSGATTSDTNVHFYEITLQKAGQLSVTIQNMESGQIFFLVDENRSSLGQITSGKSGGIWGASEVSPYTNSKSWYLEAGTYYVKIYPWDYGSYFGKYKVKATFYDGNLNETEPNQSYAEAAPVTFGEEYKGLISEQDREDWYRFTVDGQETITYLLRHYAAPFEYNLLKEDLTKIAGGGNLWGGSLSAPKADYREVDLNPGTYYFTTYFKTKSGSTSGTQGFYDFMVFREAKDFTLTCPSTLTVGKKQKVRTSFTPYNATFQTLTWTSSNPTVAAVSAEGMITPKKPGTVTITAITSNKQPTVVTKEITIKVVPGKVTIKSLKNVSGKKMKLTWKKVSGVSGYEIQYSRKSSFASAKTITVKSAKTTSRTISGLTKGKKYYVRIRAYKKGADGTLYRSAWVKKSVKIRK